MDRLIHTSMSALRASMQRQAANANNLANANTVGFKAEMSAAQSLWLQGGAHQTRAFAAESVLDADMKSGTVNQTGRTLDIALDGDALLAVQATNGAEAYTRRGDLDMSDSGLLTNGDGTPVMGQDGPITLPPFDSLKIDRDGAIWIVPPGGEPANPQLIERLKLVSPVGSTVAKGLDGLFRVKGGGALPADPTAKIIPESLEGSNVEPTRALVEMIESSRAWDTHIKLVTTARDIDDATADLMRIPN